MASCGEQLLIILDNFEDNFEQKRGIPKLVNGQPLLTATAVQLLDDLLFALQGSMEQGQEHRLLITSRYRPSWPGAEMLASHQLDKLNDEAVQKKLTRLAAAGPAPLRERAVAIADGNPRLLEWLFDLLAQEAGATPDMDAVLARMAAKESALRENILARELLAAQTPTLRQMLARCLTCELPVPTAVFDALESVAPALSNTGPERQRAAILGLLEVTPTVTSLPPHLRVPRILVLLVIGEEQPAAATLAAAAARTLYTLWWEAEAANPSEAQQVELHRLALAGGETAITQALAEALAGRWNRADQYRYREVIDLITRTVAQTTNARLWHAIGYAHSQLGEQQEALRYYTQALPLIRAVGDRGGEAATLNNLGMLHYTLNDRPQALSFLTQAADLLAVVGDRWAECTVRENISYIYREQDNWLAAVRHLLQIVTTAQAINHPNLSHYENSLNNALGQAIVTHLRSQGHADPAAHLATLALAEVEALVQVVLASTRRSRSTALAATKVTGTGQNRCGE